MMQMPQSLLKELAKQGISENSILAACETDMDETGCLRHGWVCLDREKLLICKSVCNGQQPFFFSQKGEDRMALKVERHQLHAHEKAVEEAFTTWQITAVDRALLSDLSLRQRGRMGELYIPGKDGRVLAYFTAGYMADMLQVVQMIRQPSPASRAKPQSALPEGGRGKPPEKKKKETGNYFFRLLGYFKPHMFLVLVSGICYGVVALLSLAYPYLSGTVLYDQVLAKKPEILSLLHLKEEQFGTALLFVAAAMLATKLVQLLFRHIQAFINARVVNRVINQLKKDIFTKLEELSLNFFQNSQTGSLMVRVLQDAEMVSRFLGSDFPNFFVQGFTFIATAVIMLGLQWKLALFSLILLPAVVWVSMVLKERMHSLFGQRNRANRRLTSLLNDSITGVRVVKAFGQESQVIKRFDKINGQVQKAEMDIVGYQNRFTALYSFAQSLVSLLVWAIGAWFVLGPEQMSYGMLITFAGYVTQLNGPLNFLSQAFRSYEECMNSAGRMFEILDANPQIAQPDDPVSLSAVRGHIQIKNVEFGYIPNVPVLQEFSLEVPAGTTLGIVGRSGAGKSTLVNLISHLYDVWSGEILIDGVDVRQMDPDQLHRQVAMVSQETYIFMGTVAENIAYARPKATRTEIIQAAKMASAHDFICKLPEGYDTVIGSAGKSLSGGERQRISIARAILADPAVLILDEATASVDTKTEQEIQEALTYLARGRTTLSIAHRLSTLRGANHLIVIENGRITEEGTHKELLDKKGTFYQLKELQTKALAMKGLE